MSENEDRFRCGGIIEGRTKIEYVIQLLSRPEGATIEDLTAATTWQPHTVRGAITAALKKRRGLNVISGKEDGRRVYRIIDGGAGAARG